MTDKEQMKKHCPALYNFLDTFGPPHIAIIAYIAIHTAFWQVVTNQSLLRSLHTPLTVPFPV